MSLASDTIYRTILKVNATQCKGLDALLLTALIKKVELSRLFNFAGATHQEEWEFWIQISSQAPLKVGLVSLPARAEGLLNTYIAWMDIDTYQYISIDQSIYHTLSDVSCIQLHTFSNGRSL